MFNENPKEETVIAMRNREIRLNREGEYWTDEEKEQLRTMFEAGFGITKIAYVLCRTEPAVYQQIESMDYITAKQILSGGGRLQSPVDAYVRTACVIRPFVPAV